MPYMYPDLNAARDLANAGAACIMPLGSPIGSNKGLCTKDFIQILIDEIDLPVIVDAGIGRPSQACEAMEMGAAAVMANTAIATAGDIPAMAKALSRLLKQDAAHTFQVSAEFLTKAVVLPLPLQDSCRTNSPKAKKIRKGSEFYIMRELIDHMKYLEGMEQLDSDILDRVISAMNSYDYDQIYRRRCKACPQK